MSGSQKSQNTNLDAALFALSLDPGAGGLAAQLTHRLRELILQGLARPGQRLPASRVLAQELSVSRTTVLAAYDQLTSEGYLDARQGADTRVAANLPDIDHHAASPAPAALSPPAVQAILPFQPGAPDPALLPPRLWARALHDAWACPDPGLTGRVDPQGWWPLRSAIARHLGAWRGLDCDPDQVFVTSGTVESLEIVARALLRPGERVLVEDPGFAPIRATLTMHGLRVDPVAVDDQGFDTAVLEHRQARAVVIAASRQYPLGMTLPLSRRLHLLDWARDTGGWLIEDDYDSEFRYVGAPTPALAGMDGAGRTIYLGSFSKVFSTALRLSYLVAPPALCDGLNRAIGKLGMRASLVPQPALAQLIDSGVFATHLRRMRRHYARRQAALVTAADTHLAGLLTVASQPSGMHLVASLSDALAAGGDDRQWAARAAAAGLGPRAVSSYFAGPAPVQGLVLGYSAHDEATLDAAARRLAEVLRLRP
ncbi:MAG: PLP-dependent aminotransferase family protein [Paracoccaceae bacterium]